MIKCKWCSKESKKLVEAHIIPKAFLMSDGEYEKAVISQHSWPMRRPMGSYDKTILCLSCEQRLSYIDTTASRILLKNFNNHLVPLEHESIIQLDGKYLRDIKLFLLFVLWRASVSTLPEFSKVNLGKFYENYIKEIIDGNLPLGADDFSFITEKLESPLGMAFPQKYENRDYFSGLNYYSLMLSDFVFTIKIDQRPTPKEFQLYAYHEHIPISLVQDTDRFNAKVISQIIKSREKVKNNEANRHNH